MSCHIPEAICRLLDQFDEGVLCAGSSLEVISCNRAAEELFGISCDDVKGRDLGSVLPGQALPPGWRRGAERARREGEWSGETGEVAINGGTVGLCWTVAPLPGFEDDALLWKVCHRDDRGEGWDRTLVDSADDFLFVIDRELKVAYVNPAARAFLGREGEVAGTPVAALFSEGSSQRLVDSLRRIIESGESKTIEDRFEREGGEVWLSTRLTPISEGEVIAVVGISRDITEWRRAELHAQASDERWRSLVENAPAVIIQSGLDGTILFSNRREPPWRDEIEGSRVFEIVSGADANRFRDVIHQVIERGEAAQRRVRVALGKETERWYEVAVAPVFKGGEVQSLLCIGTDVTAETVAEQQRRRIDEQIQQAQKLESLGVLAGGIAHDFNNLLVGILGNASLALTEMAPESPARESVESVEIAAKRAAELVRQMLAYSGRGRFVIEDVDLHAVVEEMAHLLEVSISKRAVLKYNFADNVPAVRADATQIRQVVMNLVTNATDAIGETSGVISVSTGAMVCDYDYLSETYLDDDLPPGVYSYIEVNDTGCGMDEETKARVFDPFFTTKFTGRGLGLAAVLGIVRGHRGAVKVYTEPGRGTSFKVLFPSLDPDSDEQDGEFRRLPISSSPPPRPRADRGTVLLVDDDETVLAVVGRMVEKLGFAVITALRTGSPRSEVFRSSRR